VLERSEKMVFDDENNQIIIPQTLREIDGGGLLEKQNPHPLDSILSFEEVGHHYFVRGIRHDALHYLSSTTFLGTFFPGFDKKKCLGYIMRGHRYVNDPDYRYYRQTEVEILDGWKALGDKASALGSRFHANVEYHCNDMAVEDNSPEFQQYLNFRMDNPELIPFRTEMLILHEEYRIVGSVDAIFKNTATGKYFIVDWKRSKKVDRKNGDKGYFPLEHLKSDNLTKYSIQLSLYRFILETVYGLEMESSALVICHPNQKQFIMMRTKYMKSDIEAMLQFRLLQLYKAQLVPVPDEIMNTEGLVEWDLVRDL